MFIFRAILCTKTMPAKFGDLTKTATDVLNDDFQVKGFQLKTKMKTNWDKAVVTSATDLWDKGEVATSSKITWKLPSPLGAQGISIDKLELDKSGAMKIEAGLDAKLHKVKDLKVEIKTDLKDTKKLAVGITFAGIKDTLIKAEVKPLGKAQEGAVLEVTRDFPNGLAAGVKLSGSAPTKPELVATIVGGPCFMAFTQKDMFKSFGVYYHHRVNSDLQISTAFQRGSKEDGVSAAAEYKVRAGTSLKAKVQVQDKSVSASVKHELSKGLSVLAGGRYGGKDKFSYGVQVSVE